MDYCRETATVRGGREDDVGDVRSVKLYIRICTCVHDLCSCGKKGVAMLVVTADDFIVEFVGFSITS